MRLFWIGMMVCGVVNALFAQAMDETDSLLGKMGNSFTCKKLDATQTLSLEEVVMVALCNNPQTTIAWQSSLYQAALVGVSESSFYPSLSANGSALKSEGSDTVNANQTKIDMTLSYLLYDFGKREASLENAKQLLRATSFSKDNTVQIVFFSAIQAYYGLFGANASLEAAKEAEIYAKESLNVAKTRYTIGTATPSDTLQAQTAYSQAVLNRIKAQGSVKNAQGTLASVLGASPDTALALVSPTLKIPTEVFENNMKTLMDEALIARPDLMAAQAKIKAYRANIEAAKAEDKPSISLSAVSGHTDSSVLDSYRNSSIGLYVSVPLFNGYNTKYKVQAAKEQLRLSQAEYEKLSQDASLEVYQTYQTLFSETNAVRASADLVASAQASYQLSMGRYKAGAGTVLDLLSVQSALASARQQYVQSLYNWYITKANLAKAMGELNFSTLKGEQ
ncbi:MAG: TolC family protein [Sulfurospirillaceae bacterium]|nr:TolC family protein [Sulfurospirillaceae bacterium]